jgi:hypothetical protein
MHRAAYMPSPFVCLPREAFGSKQELPDTGSNIQLERTYRLRMFLSTGSVACLAGLWTSLWTLHSTPMRRDTALATRENEKFRPQKSSGCSSCLVQSCLARKAVAKLFRTNETFRQAVSIFSPHRHGLPCISAMVFGPISLGFVTVQRGYIVVQLECLFQPPREHNLRGS